MYLCSSKNARCVLRSETRVEEKGCCNGAAENYAHKTTSNWMVHLTEELSEPSALYVSYCIEEYFCNIL